MRTAKERVREFMSRPDYREKVSSSAQPGCWENQSALKLARALAVLLVTTGDISYLADNDPMGVIQALEALGFKVPE